MEASLWFSAVTVIGIACLLLAAVVVAAGWRRRLAEVTILGGSLVTISALTTALGLSVTRFGGGEAPAGWAGLLALPLGALAAAPLLAPDRPWARAIAREATPWVVGTLIFSSTSAVALVRVDAAPSNPVRFAVTRLAVVGALLLARRQWFLYQVSRSRSPQVAAIAVIALTSSAIGALWAQPGTAAAWAVLALDSFGVLGACTAIALGYRSGRGVADVLAPIVSSDPLAALELGLSPEIRAFVTALEHKDQITSEHVVRTSALALRLAIRAGFDARTVRDIAVGALLHDIGKLVIPSAIINKPGSLTDDEFAEIKTHPEQGEQLLEGSPSLAGARRFVRGHHERVDGCGYPDQLAGEQVSVEVAIVSICDSWDAMTNTRQYRQGMGRDAALQVIMKGSGTQWRTEAVALLLAEVGENGTATTRPADVAAGDLPPLDLNLTEECCSTERAAPIESAIPEKRRQAVAEPAGPSCVTLIAITVDALRDIRQTFGVNEASEAREPAFRALLAGSRRHDVVAQVGEHDFIHVGDGRDWGSTEELAERVLRAVRTADDVLLVRAPSVTIGVAVAEFGDGQDVGDLLRAARANAVRRAAGPAAGGESPSGLRPQDLTNNS
ncbi:MAG: HD domain-containing protein [Actinomycetota bacterium]|nr:HD domain-containing protein [Actinomycetota bacterium]